MRDARIAIAVVLVAGVARADDPSKSPRYNEFRNAKVIVLAKLDSARVTAVLESFPPRYQFEVKLTPKEVLRGDLAKGKPLLARHSITAVNEPKLPAGMDVLVQLQPAGGTYRIVKLEPPTQELLKVARAATSAGKAQQDREDELARKDPTMHPRFKGFKEATGIAIVAVAPDGAVGFDVATRETTIDLKAAEVLKGALKAGTAFKGTFVSQGAPGALKMPATNRWLVTYRADGGTVRLLSLDEPTESLLRVARAAARK
jgi:hypothetical protein